MQRFFPHCLLACVAATLATTANAAPQFQTEQAHLGSVKVGSAATINVKVSIPAVTLGSILVQPGGAAATQEFSSASGSTCTPGKAYAQVDTCTVAVIFKPLYAGKRYGSIQLLDPSGNLIAMAWLRGTGLAPQTSFMPGKQIALDSFPEVKGLAIDGNNSVYLALGSYATTPGEGVQGGEAYLTENSDGNYAYQGQSTWGDPTGIWSDLAGNTYLYDLQLGFWESGSSSGPILGAMQPTAVTGDPFGNLYLIQTGSNTILKETLQTNPFPQNSSYLQSAVYAANSSGFQSPSGIWMDRSGNLYIQDVGQLYKWSLQPDGSFTQTYSTDLVGKVAADGSGNLYGYGLGDHHWDKETLQADGSYLRSTLSTSIYNPSSLAADSIGNIYYAQANSSGIYQAVTKEDFTQAPTLTYANTPKGATSIANKVTITNSGNRSAKLLLRKIPGRLSGEQDRQKRVHRKHHAPDRTKLHPHRQLCPQRIPACRFHSQSGSREHPHRHQLPKFRSHSAGHCRLRDRNPGRPNHDLHLGWSQERRDRRGQNHPHDCRETGLRQFHSHRQCHPWLS